MGNYIEQYPFLDGYDVPQCILDILDANLGDEKTKQKMEALLPAEFFQRYLEWKSGSKQWQFLRQIADAKIKENVESVLAANVEDEEGYLKRLVNGKIFEAYLREKCGITVTEGDFLKLLDPGVQPIVRNNLAKGEFEIAEKLIMNIPEAHRLFLEWKALRNPVEPVADRRAPAAPVMQPASPLLTKKIKVQLNRVENIDLRPLNGKLRGKVETFCEIMTYHEDNCRVFKLSGESKKVLKAALEVWAFLAKKMGYYDYLPQWQIEMVKNHWNLQKRISFMNKCQVDLWVNEKFGHDFVRMNGWLPDELMSAKNHLEDEYKKIADKIPLKKQQQPAPKPKFVDTARFPEEINILVLGQSGVGKSTFISSVANYLMHKTLEDSMEGELKIMIRFYATMYDELEVEHEILMESTVNPGDDENEKCAIGESSTQKPRSYAFECTVGEKQFVLRFIDTPGVGDTTGLEKDKELMKENMTYLSKFKHLNAVLILMNPDETRLTVGMEFCIKELLVRLHFSVSQNIIFGFPKTGGSNFREEGTRKTLRELIDKIENENGLKIPFSRDNKFAFENSGFNIRCQLDKSRQSKFVPPSDEEVEHAKASWKHSAEETVRLVNQVLKLPVNNVSDHVTINNIREAVAALARPMSEASRMQLVNMRNISDRRREIDRCKDHTDRLHEQLHVTQTMLRTVPLDKPQTVCTSPKCVEYKTIGLGMEQPIHKTVCHENCYLKGVQEEVVNNPAMKKCAAFSVYGAEQCWREDCGCDWKMHQHVRWMIETYEVTIINREVKSGMDSVEETKRQAELLLDDLLQKETEYEKNCKLLTRAGATFAVYLKQNCITSINDAFKEYLEMQIKQEKMNVKTRGTSSALLYELKKYRMEYAEQVQLFTDACQNESDCNIKTVQDLMEELKRHHQFGAFIRNAQLLEIESSLNETGASEIQVKYEEPFSYMYE